MPKQQTICDHWVLPTLRELLPDIALDAWADTVTDSYWSAAVREQLTTDEQIVQGLARRTCLPVGEELRSSPQACEVVPERIARRYGVLPLSLSKTILEVATGNPYDLDCEQLLAFVAGRRIRMVLASPAQIAARLDAAYRPERSVAKILAGVRRAQDAESVLDAGDGCTSGVAEAAASDRPMVQLVDHIVAEGISMRASDIHLEAEEGGIAVRYRIDGVLRQTMVLPRGVGMPLVSRVKIMARMDIADRLRPQGGRAWVSVNGARVDLRISTLPAAHGEKVVIRILDSRGTVQSLDMLGLDERSATRLRKLLDSREGLILVTGPTGSGKTTTLYAALQTLLRRGVNIITVEDPVEYRVPGIVQVQVNDKAGLTFAAALRSILRQDPDVVLIGEIRDRETAAIAIQAALTGHLVFATLHTIDACSSVTRLQDLGVEPAKIAAALKGVVAQRLVRRLCEQCAVVATEAIPASLWNVVPSGAGLRGPVGCAACGETGYNGRLAVTELLLVTPEIERLIASTAPTGTLMATARREGGQSLWECGVGQLLDGMTSVEEISRVLEPDDRHSAQDREDLPDEIVELGITDDSVVYRHAPNAFVDREDPRLYHTGDAVSPLPSPASMTDLKVGVVDVYLVDPTPQSWRVLALRRSADTRCPDAWEAVHGRIEEGETPEQAAVREVREETGLTILRLYNVTVHAFYLHPSTTVQFAVVFCAFVDSTEPVHLGNEHRAYEWLNLETATARYIWPRASQALREIYKLLSTGNAGPAEDVLRVL